MSRFVLSTLKTLKNIEVDYQPTISHRARALMNNKRHLNEKVSTLNMHKHYLLSLVHYF